MAKNISDIFDVYYNSGLHGASWQSTTICICKIMYEREENKNVQFVLKENARTGHAEALLLDHLEILESQGIKPKHLCLYINYSPCYQCSLRLCEYLERHPTVGIEIVFCQLYYVQRHSCQQRCPGRICSQSGSEEIETGLYNLKVNNVSLRPFNWEDWKHLIKILYHLKETNPSEYEGEILLDEGLYKMFFYGWGYLNNRENEDRLLMDDWGELDSKFQSTSLGTTDFEQKILDLYQRYDGVYGTTWKTRPCCIVAYWSESKWMPYFLDLGENIFQAEHPIFHVIDSLEESFQWGKIFDMTLFCTHSPCRGCCQKIIQFMLLHDKAISHNKPISRLSIRFVQLHQVEQAQCYPREWLQATPITDIVHNETVKALSELYANGKIDIKPFDASSWSALRQVLGRPQLQCSRELQYQESLGIKPKLLIDWKCLEAEMVKIQDRKLAAQTNQLNITY